MKSRKIICILLLIILAISIPNTNVLAKEKNYNKKNLVSILESEKIYLYYDKKSSDGKLQGFYLKLGKKVKYFDWENIDKPGFYPTIYLIKDKYIAVVCTEGEGTGVDIEQLYLLNRNTLKALIFENPLDVLESNVISEIQAPNVKIQIKNSTWNATYPDVELDHFFDTVNYGSIINYNVNDTYFTVDIPAQVTPSLFIGDFELTYYWDENESTFVPHYINFNFDNIELN
jgi:hypothetical protein